MNWQFARRIALLAAAACPTLACAFTTDTIALDYQAQRSARIVGADQVAVNVVVRDFRQDRTRVSCKKTSSGIEMAPIVSAVDIATFVRTNVRGELLRRGFRAAPTGVVVDVDVRRYYNDFKIGFFSIEADAEVDLDVNVFRLEGGAEEAPLFGGRFDGIGVNKNVLHSSGENAKVALDSAFAHAMRMMFSDRRLLAALIQSAAPNPASAPVAPPAPNAAERAEPSS